MRRRIQSSLAIALALTLVNRAPGHATGRANVVVTGARMSATLEAAPLREVLAELGRTTGAAVMGLDLVDDERVSLTFSDLPLAEGVARILRGRSFMLQVVPTGRDARLLRVTVMSSVRGEAEATGSTGPAVGVGDSGEHDAEARREALGSLAWEAGEGEARAHLAQALGADPDAAVRRAALHGLVARGLLDLEVVLRTVSEDVDAGLRAEAVRTLGLLAPGQPDAVADALALAELDDDAGVREAARELATAFAADEPPE